jgi:hypothetical protein
MSELEHHQTLTRLNVSQAAKTVGRSRSTLNRDISNGKVSLSRTGTGQPYIEIAELERAYGRVDIDALSEIASIGHQDTSQNDNSDSSLLKEVELLRERLADKDTVIDDLRRRLDAEGEERRKLTAILTDQRARSAEPTTVIPSSAPPQPAAQPKGLRGWLHRVTG